MASAVFVFRPVLQNKTYLSICHFKRGIYGQVQPKMAKKLHFLTIPERSYYHSAILIKVKIPFICIGTDISYMIILVKTPHLYDQAEGRYSLNSRYLTLDLRILAKIRKFHKSLQTTSQNLTSHTWSIDHRCPFSAHKMQYFS